MVAMMIKWWSTRTAPGTQRGLKGAGDVFHFFASLIHFFSFLLWCLSMITICLQSQWQWFDLYISFLFLFKDQTSTRPHCSLSFLLALLPLDREGVQYICCKMVEYSLYVFYYVPLESPLSSGLHERKQKKETLANK